MYFISLSIKVFWVSAPSFPSKFAAGHFLGELRLICRGRGREKRMWCWKDTEGVAFPHSEGPVLARPPWSLHFRSISPRGHAGGRAGEWGRRTCHLTFAPWPQLTQFIHCRMEGSALRSPSFARASWPDVSALGEQDSASLRVSWTAGVPIAWPGGLAQDNDTWHLKVRHAQKTAEQRSQHLGSVISSSGSKPDMEASSPPSFCFHLCSHERQDQRLDSDNELAFNIKQIKQESQGIWRWGRSLKSPPCKEKILRPGFAVASSQHPSQKSNNSPETAVWMLRFPWNCPRLSSSAWGWPIACGCITFPGSYCYLCIWWLTAEQNLERQRKKEAEGEKDKKEASSILVGTWKQTHLSFSPQHSKLGLLRKAILRQSYTWLEGGRWAWRHWKRLCPSDPPLGLPSAVYSLIFP